MTLYRIKMISDPASVTSLCPISPSADNFRPYLTSFQGNTATDYINAVFVDVSVNLHRRGSPSKPGHGGVNRTVAEIRAGIPRIAGGFWKPEGVTERVWECREEGGRDGESVGMFGWR